MLSFERLDDLIFASVTDLKYNLSFSRKFLHEILFSPVQLTRISGPGQPPGNMTSYSSWLSYNVDNKKKYD